jgi:hypothetical protein
MFSNRSSKSSSVQSLSSLVGVDENLTKGIDDINVDINFNPYEVSQDDDMVYRAPELILSDDNSLNPARQVTFTKNHPMGQIILNLIRDVSTLAQKANLKEMDTDVKEVCTQFYNAMRLGKSTTNRQIKQSAKDLEEQLIEKELNGHLLNNNTKPPTEFSPVPTITSSHLRNEAMKCFPTRSPKFSGSPSRDGGTDIIEFLSSLKTAQEYCNLSEKEFKQFLLLCTTGRAHALLIEWINLDESIPTIFHNLVMHFDKRLTPESAKELLFNYKAPKSLSLKDVETNIMLWVSRAATTLPAGPSRVAYYNMEIVQTLIRSLPPHSSARVQSVFNTLSARLGRAATATELSRALNIDRHSIDLDIQRNGADRNQRIQRSLGSNKPKKTRSGATYTLTAPQTNIIQGPPLRRRVNKDQIRAHKTIDIPPVHTTTRRVYNTSIPMSSYRSRSSSGQRQKRFPNSESMRHQRNMRAAKQLSFRGAMSRSQSRNRSEKNNDKDYCSLCGKKDHLSSDGCPYMVSDSGTRVDMMPTHSTCTLCPRYITPRLNHPSSLCPYRKGGPFSKSQ